MSSTIDTFEATWLAQLASMREAIANLNLNQPNGAVQEYGHDLLVEDDDLTGDSDKDDIWAVFSDEGELACSSDSATPEDSPMPEEKTAGGKHDEGWLQSKCVAFTSQKSGLDARELHEQLLALLVSDIQGTLEDS